MDPKQGTIIIANQIYDLLDLLTNEQYSQKLTTFNGSTIGQHTRHIIDFYLCLVNGTLLDNIDYDRRQRNPLIESDIEVARATIEGFVEKVGNLDVQKMVKVHSCFSPEEEQTGFIGSSVGRELMYAYDHAIHHLAMIKIGLNIHFPTIPVSKDLGVAPSTLKYRKGIASS